MGKIQALVLVTVSLSGIVTHAQISGGSAQDEKAIREADTRWSQSANINHLDEFLSFYADDASVLPFGSPVVSGKDNIREFFKGLMSKPGFAVTFGPTKIEVAKSRDLAYEIGAAQLTLNDAQGQPSTTPAKYVVVWRKDATRHWKAVADISNTDK